MGIQWHKIHKKPALRQFVLKVLEKCNPGDIHIRHHYTGDRLLLHSFKHKGYWYHGKRREEETMEFFRAAIAPGETVIEVGGHIGYISMFLAQLAGDKGRVFVFEPGSNNRRYIEANVTALENLELIDEAVSNENGTAKFHEEALTGQNNSLIGDYSVFEKNKNDSFSDEGYSVREVKTVTLDSFTQERDLHPTLLKIDVEGAEWLALQGGHELFKRDKPAMMVEVTNEKAEVVAFLHQLGYELFDESARHLKTAADVKCNVFAVCPDKHAKLMRKLNWNTYS